MTDPSLLRSRVSGPVLVAEDDGYAEESLAFITNYTHTPDVIVGAASAADVAQAVIFAAAEGLPVRVQGPGHGSHSAITDGVLITTKRLDSVEVDPATRIATIGAGVPWGAVVAAGAQHGLAPVTGSSGTVGAIGFLLGGGLGPLVNSYGYGSDWVREFEVVLANGDLVTASADEHPDLFWALRGGKGGLAVVTSAKLELVELATLYGGSLLFDAENIDAALHAWVDYQASAEPQVTTSAAIFRFPDLPFIPEPMRGRTLLSVRFAYTGDAETGAKLAAPLRSAAPVYIDDLGQIPASAIDTIHGDPTDPTVGWVNGHLLGGIDQEFVTTLLDFVGVDQHPPFISVELRSFGAAPAHDVPGGSAVGGRGAKGVLSIVGVPNPELFAAVIPGAANAVFGALARWISPENNVNFMSGFTTAREYRSAWSPAIFERLAEVRQKYDPTGLFVYGVH